MADPRIPIPAQLAQELNSELRGRPDLLPLDDNQRYLIRRLVEKAYGNGYDDGRRRGDDDAHTDMRIEREKQKAADS